jgi:hypothetical protein
MTAADLERTQAPGPNAAGERSPDLVTMRRTRRLLRAVERYKAACAAASQRPDETDSWAVLLAALAREDD